MTKSRKTFSPEFQLEAAQLVVDQHYTVRAACEAMGVSKSTMENWVHQLRQERQGNTPKATAITAEQRRIQDLEKRLRQVEIEKEFLKKATSFPVAEKSASASCASTLRWTARRRSKSITE